MATPPSSPRPKRTFDIGGCLVAVGCLCIIVFFIWRFRTPSKAGGETVKDSPKPAASMPVGKNVQVIENLSYDDAAKLRDTLNTMLKRRYELSITAKEEKARQDRIAKLEAALAAEKAKK
jgi:hypothetical protein